MKISGLGSLDTVKAIHIKAPVAKVWKIHTDIGKWRSWHPAVSEAALDGPLRQGAVFRWKYGGLQITSTVEKVVDNEEIHWSGKAPGMRARHKWFFKKKDGGTIVSTEETMSGWFVLIMRIVMPRFLEKSIDQWLEHLKVKAEAAK